MVRRWRNPRQWPGAVWDYFTSIVIIVTCPCWCLPIWGWVEYDDYKIRKRNSDQEFQKRRASYVPDLMPEKRDRDLEIPLEHPTPVHESQSRLRNRNRKAVMQQTKSQQQSQLLQKLPLDIRLLIWKRCVGGELLHIVREPGRLGYIICPFWKLDLPLLFPLDSDTRDSTRTAIAEWASPDYTSNHICWSPQDTDGLSYARTRESKLFGLNNIGRRAFLPLLQTCRQIYTEALPVLYQNNIFDVKSLDALLSFPRTTIHVDLIRSLRLSWNFCADPLQPRSNPTRPPRRRLLFSDAIPPFDLDTWLQACNFLSKMKGLKDLVIMVEGVGWISQNPESASQLLLPLTGVRVGRRFEVHVPWEANEWEDAIVAIVGRQQERVIGRLEESGEGDKWPEEIGWASRVLQESAEANAAGSRLTLDMWSQLLKNKERRYEIFKKAVGTGYDDVIELDVQKGKEKEKDITKCEMTTGIGAHQSQQKVGFTIIRRVELLDITKLPTFPARKKRRRNKAFGRR